MSWNFGFCFFRVNSNYIVFNISYLCFGYYCDV